MRRMISGIVHGCMALMLWAGVCFGQDASGNKESDIGRYQLYSTTGQHEIVMMLDTKTGKIWQINTDMAGKLQVLGVTVEGLVFSSKDSETMARQLAEINLDDVIEGRKKPCKDELAAVFSYRLDKERIDRVLIDYLKSQ